MLETSRDILNIVLAVCIFGFTVFVCWAMFYVIASVRKIFKLTQDIADVIGKINSLVDSIKDKVHNSIAYLPLIGEGVKKIVEIVKSYSDKKSKSGDEKNE